MNSVHFMSKKSDWETPQDLFNRLNDEFHFTLDAAASDLNHKLPHYYTEKEDGLAQDWGGERVFCNPPYGSRETGLWTEKCWREAQKPDTLVVLLIPARTDRKSFHDFIYNKPNVTIRFLKGRLQFEDNGKKMGTAPFPSMICIFNEHLK
jgi:phage N-6-adenine-methyltransferase